MINASLDQMNTQQRTFYAVGEPHGAALYPNVVPLGPGLHDFSARDFAVGGGVTSLTRLPGGLTIYPMRGERIRTDVPYRYIAQCSSQAFIIRYDADVAPVWGRPGGTYLLSWAAAYASDNVSALGAFVQPQPAAATAVRLAGYNPQLVHDRQRVEDIVIAGALTGPTFGGAPGACPADIPVVSAMGGFDGGILVHVSYTPGAVPSHIEIAFTGAAAAGVDVTFECVPSSAVQQRFTIVVAPLIQLTTIELIPRGAAINCSMFTASPYNPNAMFRNSGLRVN